MPAGRCADGRAARALKRPGGIPVGLCRGWFEPHPTRAFVTEVHSARM